MFANLKKKTGIMNVLKGIMEIILHSLVALLFFYSKHSYVLFTKYYFVLTLNILYPIAATKILINGLM